MATASKKLLSIIVLLSMSFVGVHAATTYDLIIALRNGKTEQARQMIENGVNVNDELNPPLVIACRYHWTYLAKLMLEHGADVNAKEAATKRTALQEAAYAVNPDLIRLLLDHGADVNIVDQSGNSILHLALYSLSANSSDRLKTVAILVSHGANVNVCNQEGVTVLASALNNAEWLNYSGDKGSRDSASSYTEIAALLKRYGAKLGSELQQTEQTH